MVSFKHTHLPEVLIHIDKMCANYCGILLVYVYKHIGLHFKTVWGLMCKYALIPEQIMWDLWWTKWHCAGFSSSISVLFYPYHSTSASILFFTFTLLLQEGRAGTLWTTSQPKIASQFHCNKSGITHCSHTTFLPDISISCFKVYGFHPD